MNTTARSIDAPTYDVGPTDDDAIIARALSILTNRLNVGDVMINAQVVRQYLTLKAAAHDGYEVFGVLFLDAQNCVKQLTQRLKETLALIDVRVLDHVITAGGKAASMAELGLM